MLSKKTLRKRSDGVCNDKFCTLCQIEEVDVAGYAISRGYEEGLCLSYVCASYYVHEALHTFSELAVVRELSTKNMIQLQKVGKISSSLDHTSFLFSCFPQPFIPRHSHF